MKVRVFRNLTRDCYSVQAKGPAGWRTVAHASEVTLWGAAFEVSQAGRKRVLESGKKQVHAFVRGELLQWQGEVYRDRGEGLLHPRDGRHGCPAETMQRVSYNPRRADHFVQHGSKGGTAPIETAQVCILDPHGVYAR